MTRLGTHLKANAVAYAALFVALGGSAYAATALPADSVGTRQLRNEAVTNKKLATGSVSNRKLAKGAIGPGKLDPGSIVGYTRAYVQINGLSQITASRPTAKVLGVGSAGQVPQITIQWSRPIPSTCFAEATTLDHGDVSYASASLAGGPKGDALTYISLSGPGHPVNVAIICPQT
jgi:hypothetical protein